MFVFQIRLKFHNFTKRSVRGNKWKIQNKNLIDKYLKIKEFFVCLFFIKKEKLPIIYPYLNDIPFHDLKNVKHNF